MKKILKLLSYFIIILVLLLAGTYFYVNSQIKITEQGVLSTNEVPYIGIKVNDVAMNEFSKIVPETYLKLEQFKKQNPEIEFKKPFTIYQKSQISEKLSNVIIGFETPHLYPDTHEAEVFSGIRKSILAMKFEAIGSYDYLPFVWLTAFMKVGNSETYQLNENEFGFEVYETNPEDNNVAPKDYQTFLYLPVVEK
ncbi:MAG: hypothetical protein ACK5N8_08950 [Alphaproteobacteria bacterium]